MTRDPEQDAIDHIKKASKKDLSKLAKEALEDADPDYRAALLEIIHLRELLDNSTKSKQRLIERINDLSKSISRYEKIVDWILGNTGRSISET